MAPDLFAGQPAPTDINNTTYNSTAFLAAHGTNVTDPLVEAAISYARTSLNVSKVAVTGYCFGGRYSMRFTDQSRTIKADVAFAAHPSLWTDAEASALGAPTAFATAGMSFFFPCGLARAGGLFTPGFCQSLFHANFFCSSDRDNLLPAARRAQLEALLLNTTTPYQVSLYSGVSHGFGVRINASDPIQVFAKETAFLQAVRWFTSF